MTTPRPAELVVFLPAVGGDPSFWEPQRAALAGRYRVLALHLRRPAAEVSIAAFADDVAAAIDDEGYARAHVAGLSLGGVVALELFRRHPGRVQSLLLANTWAWQADGEGRLAWAEGEWARRSHAEFSRGSLPGLFAPTTPRALVERAVAVESAKDPDLYRACWRAMLRADLRDVLPRVDVPVTLVGGPLDPVTPTRPLLTDIHDALPAARLVELAGASHFSNLDQPEAFNRVLLGHLRSARAGDLRLLAGAPLESRAARVALPRSTAAERLLRLLELRGVDVLACNSGTDFTPLIEALARLGDADAGAGGGFALRVVAAPHENTAVAIAHGHALLSRRPQAVMAHVNVGTANMGLGLINARRARVPMLVLAGRTPWYEDGPPGVRTNFVQWGQETFDQAAMFREFTKWDYELRSPQALETVVDRALAIAASDPAGPVYLALPKEALCAEAKEGAAGAEPVQTPARPALPDAAALAAARARLARARRPLIVTADLGRHAGGPEALVRFARAWSIGVVEHGKRNFFNFPTEDPHHQGFEPAELVRACDLLVAVECPVPYIPALTGLERAPETIQIGVDPLFADLPLRGFASDLTLAGDPVATLRALATEAPARPDAGASREALAARHVQLFGAARAAAEADGGRPAITKRFLSREVGRQLAADDVLILNEYDLDPWLVPRRCADSWLENSVASGLGWSLGAAIGAKLAAPEKTVVVTLGDGAYLFNTPLSAHHVMASLKLPILVLVFNDRAWSTIKRSTRGSHPDGAAARSGRFALCDFDVDVAYERVAEAAGGVGLRVERPAEVPGALAHALQLVRTGERFVLVNALCERDG